MSEDAKTIHQLVPMVMASIGVVGKDHQNQQFNYQFRSIDDVVNRLHPALVAHGVSVGSEILSTATESYTTGKGTVMRWAKVEMRYRLTGPLGDSVVFEGVGEAADSSDKAHMKAMQQAFKYAMVQGLAIPTGEVDADSQSPELADPTRWAKLRIYEAVGRDKDEATAVWFQAHTVLELDPEKKLSAPQAQLLVETAKGIVNG